MATELDRLQLASIFYFILCHKWTNKNLVNCLFGVPYKTTGIKLRFDNGAARNCEHTRAVFFFFNSRGKIVRTLMSDSENSNTHLKTNFYEAKIYSYVCYTIYCNIYIYVI